jgi:hypothetical protein
VVTVALALVSPPAAAHAQCVQGRWSVTFAGGGDFQAGGTVHEGGSGAVLGLPTSVEGKSFGDVYDAGYRVALGVGYGVAERVEIIGNVNFGTSSSKGAVTVGDVGGLELLGDFKEYKDLGVEGGVRVHFAPGAAIDPYVNLVGGVRRVDAISPTFSLPAAGVVLSDVGFYDKSTVGTVGGDFGLGVALGANAVLGIEAGLRWSGALKQVEGLAGTGLENLNDEGSRLSVPLLGTLTVRF